MEEKIKPLTICISKKEWDKFKSKISKDRTLNEAVVELIIKYNKA